jgi:3',5'-cyclic AMP phosphodiesterase CpdA
MPSGTGKNYKSTLTWLHISDLHFSESQVYEESIVVQALLQDLKHWNRFAPEIKKLDFVFLTGDIAFSGQAAEYHLASRFLDELKRVTHGRKRQFFLVPGNHDVYWSLITDEARQIINEIKDEKAVSSFLNNDVNRAKIFEKFKHYQEFIKTYFGNNLTFDNVNYYYVKKCTVAEKTIAILGLNSSWASASDADRQNLLLGEKQVRDALEKAGGADIRIVLLHHPFEWLQDFDRSYCQPILLKGADFILRGHLHNEEIIRQQSPGVDAMIFAAGACYETRKYPNSYHLVHLDLESGQGTAYLRTYSDKDGGFWTCDCTTYKDVNGEYNFEFKKVGKASNLSKPQPPMEPGVKKWWQARGYKSDPFNYLNAAEVNDKELPALFENWYVDPKVPSENVGLGNNPTLDKVISLRTGGLVIIYAPQGGGKTFYRRLAAKQIQTYEMQAKAVEICDLAGKLENEKISALSLTRCVYTSIGSQLSIPAFPSPSGDMPQQLLTKLNIALMNWLDPKEGSIRLFVFINDVEALFEAHDRERNRLVLNAFADFCEIVSIRAGDLFSIRLLFPLELMNHLHKLISQARYGRIQEEVIRWQSDNYEAIIAARLKSYWSNEEKNPNEHLGMLLDPDANTVLHRWLKKQKGLSPRFVVHLMGELGRYACTHKFSPDRPLRDTQLNQYLKSTEVPALYPEVKYP